MEYYGILWNIMEYYGNYGNKIEECDVKNFFLPQDSNKPEFRKMLNMELFNFYQIMNGLS